MRSEEFSKKIRDAQIRVRALSQKEDVPSGREDPIVAELTTTLEELQVAEEELRQQNEELLATRAALEAEHERYLDLFQFAPDGYLVTDSEGSIQEANRAASQLLKMEPRFLKGKPLAVFVHQSDRKRFHAELSALLADGGVREREFEMAPRKGRSVHVAVKAALVPRGKAEPPTLRWLLRDITERGIAEEQRAQLIREQAARVEAEAAAVAKDEFLALVSHELRTPLTTIYGNVQLLKPLLERLDRNGADTLSDVLVESQRLREMVDNLLLLAKVELARKPDVQDVEARPAVTRAMGISRREQPARRIDVKAEPGIVVRAVPTYLEGTLRNLLSNVLKYTPRHTPIEIRVERRNESEAAFLVRDRGPGIGAGEAEAVFDRFYRSPVTPDASSGVGLGLTVCKRLVEAQGGRVWARSREGGGLEVGFTLPTATLK